MPEFNKKASKALAGSDDAFILDGFYYTKRTGGFYAIPWQYILLRGKKPPPFIRVPFYINPSILEPASVELEQEWLRASCSTSLRACYALNIKGSNITHKSSPMLITGKGKKYPKIEYKKVSIHPGSVTIKSIPAKDAGGDKRNSPRFHLRRGHVRRANNGKVWIKPVWVGDPKRGVIKKDYDVFASPNIS